VVIRVYSAHLTIAGEASLRSATHLERLPKSLTSARCHQVRALLVGRGNSEPGEFRGTREPGAFDPESSHLKIFRGFFETLSKRRGPWRVAASSYLPGDRLVDGRMMPATQKTGSIDGMPAWSCRSELPGAPFPDGRVVPTAQNSTSRHVRTCCQGGRSS
jgi:hypothetical protein